MFRTNIIKMYAYCVAKILEIHACEESSEFTKQEHHKKSMHVFPKCFAEKYIAL